MLGPAGNTHVLPSSRLKNQDFGVRVMDWTCPGGQVVRCECVPVFCANCGAPHGYVPKDGNTFDCWLCTPCFEKYGQVAGAFAVPDDEFQRAVAFELQAKAKELGLGRDLNEFDILALAEQGRLGSALEKLEKDSPYKVWNGH